jgi:hypothetical protein
MADDKKGTVHGTSDGGVTGLHDPADPFHFLVGPSTSAEYNTARLRLIPIACFRIDDVRFQFDSSFVLPAIKEEMDTFSNLRKENPNMVGAPISIFGHADPSFQGNFELGSATQQSGDDYNKTLSGRRAMAIYALLTRDAAIWNTLYNHHLGGDVWGEDAIRTILNHIDSQDPSKNKPGQPQGSSAPGSSSPSAAPSPGSSDPPDDPRVARYASDGGQRQQLFLQYMNLLCGDLKLDKSSDFLARNAGPDQKGDVQGCSRFNPLIVFSQEKEDLFKKAWPQKDKVTLAERNERNRPNRRVMILVFRKGSQVLPAKWPCPTFKEGGAACKKRFFSDGDQRRSTHLPGAERKFDDTHDTFACRFYQRISAGGPCDQVLQYWVVRILAEGMGPLSKRKPLANELFVLTGSGSPFPEIRGVTNALGILRVPVVSPVCTMTLQIAGVRVILDGGLLLSLQEGKPAVEPRLYNLGYGTPDTESWTDDVFSANVKEFQKDQSLEQSGSVDDQTQTQLRELYGS